ncbi:MAG: hypothetical protein LBS96_07775 [Oscillospiraceae bacterium]|jgi:hypothetical protein|nr:hypothetical protein [Oscillospiraceae bacterium]
MPELKRGKRTHKWAFPLGLLLLALAIVGAVTLVSLLARGVKQIAEHPQEVQQYEEFLRPIVEHDPDPFDSVEKANTTQLLDISIWSLLRADPDAEHYQTDADDGFIVIPQADVEKAFKRLFGKEVAVHATIEGADYTFEYDEVAKVYRVPQTGTLSIYVPRVASYKKVGNSVELEVEYLGYSTIDWADAPDGVPVRPEPMQTRLITLYITGDGQFTVGSIQVPVGRQTAVLEALGSTRIQPPEEEQEEETEAATTTAAG